MILRRFGVIKPEIRVLGIDDSMFNPRSKSLVLVVGVVFRGGYWLDGVMHTRVKVDGFDAGSKIASMILESPHCKQLRIIMLNGVTFAGFNVVDIKKLNIETSLPVMALTRDKPDLNAIHEALNNLSRSEERWHAIRSGGKVIAAAGKNKTEKIHMQISGISIEDAKRLLRITSTRSNFPEALRVAHLIASGVSGS